MMATIAGQFHWFVSDSMRDLKANDAALLDLSVSYRNYIADNSARIRHLVFYEKQGLLGEAKPVEPMSADPGIAGVRPVAINRDHRTICKPETRDDQVYKGLGSFRIFVHGQCSGLRRRFEQIRISRSRPRRRSRLFPESLGAIIGRFGARAIAPS